jgi:hypothetical protein
MIIAALVAFGALLVCWLLAAPEPDAGRQPAAAATAEPIAPDLVQAA